MPSKAKHLLLTGRPGCGKTTVIQRLVELLSNRQLAGSYTRELREKGQRVGFEAVGLNGDVASLAHIGFHSPYRVGRYGVKLDEFDALAQSEVDRSPDEIDLFVVDEIGKMECFSPVFVDGMRRILAGEIPLVATIAQKGGGFVSEVIARDDVEVLTVTATNRDELPERLAKRFVA